LLASSGVAGLPESYFRAQDEATWASRFGLAGAYSYLDFVRQARAHGTTDNGVFGARVMWGTLDELLDKIRRGTESGSDLEVLRALFGDLTFVHLWREDALAQAVSWALAEKSNVWHATVNGRRSAVRKAPEFDREMVSNLLDTIDAHNQSWREWFASVDTHPCEVLYEDLARDPFATGSRVLQALGIAVPATPLEVRFDRLSDKTNTTWLSRYRSGTRLPHWLRGSMGA
jgi:LPS sulfotransferase NodH